MLPATDAACYGSSGLLVLRDATDASLVGPGWDQKVYVWVCLWGGPQ